MIKYCRYFDLLEDSKTEITQFHSYSYNQSFIMREEYQIKKSKQTKNMMHIV